MGKHSWCAKQKLRKGLWSPEEDKKLYNYVTHYGVGCWSSVPKLAATHLPGRTDNEIKNFWNSYIKKKLIKQGIDPQTHQTLNTQSQVLINNNNHPLENPSEASTLRAVKMEHSYSYPLTQFGASESGTNVDRLAYHQSHLRPGINLPQYSSCSSFVSLFPSLNTQETENMREVSLGCFSESLMFNEGGKECSSSSTNSNAAGLSWENGSETKLELECFQYPSNSDMVKMEGTFNGYETSAWEVANDHFDLY
ncbi:hypothetical protein Cgig2_012764 [Carnegiea gigantea]|uniref:Uncharacterized protein n=1 Tax=Carnegiea gigantea TaxID=171969 RepID=A0A9Q1KCH2_9CARY|nr:hypothetical protein Cgig2_012764 [Carnegiea gigantea]